MGACGVTSCGLGKARCLEASLNPGPPSCRPHVTGSFLHGHPWLQWRIFLQCGRHLPRRGQYPAGRVPESSPEGTAEPPRGVRWSEWETRGAAGPGPQLSRKLRQDAVGAASCVSRAPQSAHGHALRPNRRSAVSCWPPGRPLGERPVGFQSATAVT